MDVVVAEARLVSVALAEVIVDVDAVAEAVVEAIFALGAYNFCRLVFCNFRMMKKWATTMTVSGRKYVTNA